MPASTHSTPDHSLTRRWVEAARAMDAETLHAGLRAEWDARGPVAFLEECAGPFVDALGAAWANGHIDVYHEHFASERLRDFLASKWRPLSKSATGPTILLTTLPGERHALGLHMAAVVVALSGCKVAYLGNDTPLSDIEGGARQTRAKAVLLSISLASDSAQVRSSLRVLRQRLPDEIAIVIGGGGAPAELPGSTHFPTLSALHTWARRTAVS